MLNVQTLKIPKRDIFLITIMLYISKDNNVIKNLKWYFEIRKTTIIVSFNFITIIVELNQINALTFMGNPFLTSEFEITHNSFFFFKTSSFFESMNPYFR